MTLWEVTGESSLGGLLLLALPALEVVGTGESSLGGLLLLDLPRTGEMVGESSRVTFLLDLLVSARGKGTLVT